MAQPHAAIAEQVIVAAGAARTDCVYCKAITAEKTARSAVFTQAIAAIETPFGLGHFGKSLMADKPFAAAREQLADLRQAAHRNPEAALG